MNSAAVRIHCATGDAKAWMATRTSLRVVLLETYDRATAGLGHALGRVVLLSYSACKVGRTQRQLAGTLGHCKKA